MTQKRVFVFPAGSDAARGDLADVLGRLECVEIVREVGDADVVVVLMGGPLLAEGALRAALAPVADGVFDLIGVHDPNGDGSIPVVMEDWATAGFYALDEEALRTALCDEEEGWLDASGQPRAEPKTERECSKKNC